MYDTYGHGGTYVNQREQRSLCRATETYTAAECTKCTALNDWCLLWRTLQYDAL